jgi:hypothetical protein
MSYDEVHQIGSSSLPVDHCDLSELVALPELSLLLGDEDSQNAYIIESSGRTKR